MAHILLVEDDDAYREMLHASLEDRGHTVVDTRDGHEALQYFKSGHFDLVITDILMPKKDGVETIIEMRRIDAQVRIIAISGGGHLVPATNCLKIARSLGVNEVLQKPFTMDALEACITAEMT